MILLRAAEIASVDGLEGVTIGRLAVELGMSKSGVFSHFGAKEELQISTVHAAAEIFSREVVVGRPAIVVRNAEKGADSRRQLPDGPGDHPCVVLSLRQRVVAARARSASQAWLALRSRGAKYGHPSLGSSPT